MRSRSAFPRSYVKLWFSNSSLRSRAPAFQIYFASSAENTFACHALVITHSSSLLSYLQNFRPPVNSVRCTVCTAYVPRHMYNPSDLNKSAIVEIAYVQIGFRSHFCNSWCHVGECWPWLRPWYVAPHEWWWGEVNCWPTAVRCCCQQLGHTRQVSFISLERYIKSCFPHLNCTTTYTVLSRVPGTGKFSFFVKVLHIKTLVVMRIRILDPHRPSYRSGSRCGCGSGSRV